MTAQTLAGSLADDRRRVVFAAIVLDAHDVPAIVARTGLPARDVVTAVRRLTAAEIVTDDGTALRVDGERLRELARIAEPVPAPAANPREAILRTFLKRLPAPGDQRPAVESVGVSGADAPAG